MRSLLPALLLLAACAYPPGASSGDDHCEEKSCAGHCVKGVCFPAAIGEACDPDGEGVACEAGGTCVSGVCRREACTGDPCSCPGAPRCAGRCVEGLCVGAEPGEPCDRFGLGPTCREGSCVDGRCTLKSTPVPLESWRDALSKAQCDWLVGCHLWPSSLADSCPDFVAPSTPSFNSLAANVRAADHGLIAYDAVEAGDCLAAWAVRDCFGARPAACDRVFKGASLEGESCQTDESCAADLWCLRVDPTGLSCGGTCEARAGKGEDCSAARCLEGLVCVEEEGGDVCLPPGAPGGVGAPCLQAFGACAPGLFCDAGTGRCALRAKEGDPCDDWYGCEDGLACAVIASSRAECLPVRALGEACVSHQQCSPGHALVADAACIGGVCRKLPQWGECAGDGWLANRCDPTVAWCDNEGECRPIRQTGEGCSDSNECGVLSQNVCSFWTCQSPDACESP